MPSTSQSQIGRRRRTTNPLDNSQILIITDLHFNPRLLATLALALPPETIKLSQDYQGYDHQALRNGFPMAPRHSSAAAPGPGSKLRRAHRKSRNGCLECKRRHIKCDEKRPRCNNCLVSDRACSFPPAAAVSSGPAPASPASAGVATEASTPASTSVPSHPSPAPVPVPAPASAPIPAVVVTHDYSSGLGAAENNSSSGANPIRLPPPLPPSPRQHPSTYPNDDLPPHPFATARQPVQSSITNPLGQPIFTALHLTLLHHAKTAPLFSPEMIQRVLDIAMTWAIDGPYLLDQVLALSADHLIKSSPERAHAYHGIANELQTRALMFFNLESQNQTDEDAQRTHLPRFVFSSLLSMRMLHETFHHHRASFHVFIERFLESVLLHQGVRAVLQSGFSPAYGWASAEPLFAKFWAAGRAATKGNIECSELNKAIEASDLGPAAIAACKSAAESLQSTFNMHTNLPDDSNTHAASAFPIMLTPEFIDVLRKHRPEALLVMAYYGALLHRCRRSWVVGDAGQFLVHLIANHLGNFWREPMQWPLQVISDEIG